MTKQTHGHTPTCSTGDKLQTQNIRHQVYKLNRVYNPSIFYSSVEYEILFSSQLWQTDEILKSNSQHNYGMRPTQSSELWSGCLIEPKSISILHCLLSLWLGEINGIFIMDDPHIWWEFSALISCLGRSGLAFILIPKSVA